MAETPALRKKLLGRELAHLRKQAGMEQEPAGELIGKKQAGIAQIEGGWSTVSQGDLEKLLTNYGITEQSDPDEWRLCLEWRKGSRQPRNYWSGHKAVYSEGFRPFVELETDCDLVQATATEHLPDWLQTEAYMRAMLGARPSKRLKAIPLNEAVGARLARQEVFHRPDAPELHLVMSASAFREFGPPDMMRPAVDNVIELSKRTNFKIQVVPLQYEIGRVQASVGYKFTRFRIPSSGRAGPLHYACTQLGGQYHYTDDPSTVSLHEDEFADLSAIAPDYVRSRNIMIKIREALGR